MSSIPVIAQWELLISDVRSDEVRLGNKTKATTKNSYHLVASRDLAGVLEDRSTMEVEVIIALYEGWDNRYNSQLTKKNRIVQNVTNK